MKSIFKQIVSLALSSVLAIQNFAPTYALVDEIHLINDLGSSGIEMSLVEQAERNWNNDLLSVAKGSWYDAKDKDEEFVGTPSNLAATASNLSEKDIFEDFDEVKAQRDIERLLKKADKKDVVSQSGSYIVSMLKEAAIPKDGIPRESTLKAEILSLYRMNDEDYTIFQTDDTTLPERGDIIFFSKSTESKATISDLRDTTAEEENGEHKIKRRASGAVIGGIVFNVTTDGISFVYSAEKNSASIGYMPIGKKEFIGYASVRKLHDKYCGVLEEELDELEEEQTIEEEILAAEEKIPPAEPFSYEETIWGYRISLNAEAGVFPVGTTVSVKPVTTIEGQNIEELLKKQDESGNITKVMSFDITFTCDDEEIQPEDGSVSVSIKLASDMLKEKRKSDTAEISVYHIQNVEEIEKVPSDVTSRNEVVYDAESFSVYSVALSMAASGLFEYKVFNGKATITKYNSTTESLVVVPSKIDGYVVNEIGLSAFQNHNEIITIQLPDSLQIIGNGAFEGCTNMHMDSLPAQLIEIGSFAFQYCDELEINRLPTSLQEIRFGAFWGCDRITNIWIPKSLKRIDAPFESCYSLCSATFEEGFNDTKNIFEGAGGLTTVNLPKSLTVIGDKAFCNSGIKSINIPNSVTTIGESAFSSCELENIVIPDSVKSIGRDAFYCCVNLDRVVLPKQLAELSDSLFSSCVYLDNITVPESVTTIGSYSFGNMTHLNTVIVPAMITDISPSAFNDSKNVTIWGFANTELEKLAKEKSIPFKYLMRSANFERTQEWVLLNGTKTLNLVKNPSNTSETSFTWTSSNPAVVSVDSKGVIKGLKEGTAMITATTLAGYKATCNISVTKQKNGWNPEGGKDYWYENGIKQGTTGRGKEIYDPGTNAWYWLDSIQGGAKAVSKEVYQESNGGKWVRYDAQGQMIKGWYSNEKGTYYYDLVTGAMAKGDKTIDKIPCYFNTTTGIGVDGWRSYGKKQYWYEHGERQGTLYDKKGILGDGIVRGREIYDPKSNAWYWLDANTDGAKAVSKEVWMPYIYQNEKKKTKGKWVRYNANGGMIKGWYTTGNKKYYYDLTTGAMVKGSKTIDGKYYRFDSTTGVLVKEYSFVR